MRFRESIVWEGAAAGDYGTRFRESGSEAARKDSERKDNLVRPPLKMFSKGEGGTLETLYLMFIALLLIPVTIAQTMFGFGGGSTDNLMAVVGAMDMVAGDVAATADETGEEEGKEKEAEEA